MHLAPSPRRRGATRLVAALALLALAGPPGLGSARAAAVGDTAPELQLPTTPEGAGGTLRLSDLRGQTVYLDFWASWCGPCKQSFPWMNGLQQRLGARGLQVVAINLDARPDDARRFLAQVPARFKLAYDRQGETPRRYAVKAMPTSLLIGPDGQVLMVHEGFRPEDAARLEAAIAKALPPAPAATP